MYIDVQARHLSGGNKRKLCLAIAFLGSDVILLDEPTAGKLDLMTLAIV